MIFDAIKRAVKRGLAFLLWGLAIPLFFLGSLIWAAMIWTGLARPILKLVVWIFGKRYLKAVEREDEHMAMFVECHDATESLAESLEWFHEKAEQGDAVAQSALGMMYAEGYCEVTQDDAEAVKWYQKAAEQGDMQAQFCLGEMYAEGRGLAQDEAEAARWYQKAAEQGHEEAQDALEDMKN